MLIIRVDGPEIPSNHNFNIYVSGLKGTLWSTGHDPVRDDDVTTSWTRQRTESFAYEPYRLNETTRIQVARNFIDIVSSRAYK